MQNFYKILKAYIGSKIKPDILAFYIPGYTTFVVSDDFGIMFYFEENILQHDAITFNIDDLEKVLSKKRNYNINIQKNTLVIELKNEIVKLECKKASAINIPTFPQRNIVINANKLLNVYDDIAFFNSAEYEKSNIAFTNGYICYRSNNAELVTTFEGFEEYDFSVPFPALSHAIKVLKLTKDEVVNFGISNDLYISGNNFLMILPFKKHPVPYILKNKQYIGDVELKYTNQDPEVYAKNGYLFINDIKIGQYSGRFHKMLPKNKVNNIIKKYGKKYETYIWHGVLLFKVDNKEILFY